MCRLRRNWYNKRYHIWYHLKMISSLVTLASLLNINYAIIQIIHNSLLPNSIPPNLIHIHTTPSPHQTQPSPLCATNFFSASNPKVSLGCTTLPALWYAISSPRYHPTHPPMRLASNHFLPIKSCVDLPRALVSDLLNANYNCFTGILISPYIYIRQVKSESTGADWPERSVASELRAYKDWVI